MNQKEKCIFHIPNHIDEKGISGSQVRPIKMLQAFKNIGYDVDVVMGYGKERKENIKRIKKNIKEGMKYDFLYSESSTMPTLLTEKNHFPSYPFLDFSFFDYCKKHDIKIGLFYRDIHWKFEQYKKKVPWYQKMLTIPMYKYDLFQYKKYLDIIYLSTKRVIEHIPEIKNKIKMEELPPGAEKRIINKVEKEKYKSKTSINIFYVGGVMGIYEFENVLKAIKDKSYVNLIICTRKDEWESAKDRYSNYLTERVKVVHKTGKELEPFYKSADICSCYFSPGVYMDMAMPIKLLEYVSYQVPIICTKGMASADFVERYDCGFSIPYSEKSFGELLEEIYKNPAILFEKYNNVKQCANENTWEKRAQKVVCDLTAK